MITFKAKTPSGEIIKSALSSFLFPAGEPHVTKEPKRELERVEIAIIQPSADSLHDDLFKLNMWSDYILRHDNERSQSGDKTSTKTVALIPYFPGARADRGKPFGLQVYTEFISRLLINQVIVFDPHSDETLYQLKTVENQPTTSVYSHELFNTIGVQALINVSKYSGIIAPDKGAVERAQKVADTLGLPLFKASKIRDEATGKLSGFSVEPLPKAGKLLLIDDICDRGGTFLGLAEASGLSADRLDLFVSHGVFSSDATENLPQKFGRIFTTNSYNPHRELEGKIFGVKFVRFDVIRLMLDKVNV